MSLKFVIGKSHEEALISLSNYFTFHNKHIFMIKLFCNIIVFLTLLWKIKLTVIKSYVSKIKQKRLNIFFFFYIEYLTFVI